MKTYKTEGIILKRSNFGEADKILTIFTRHLGKIRVLARGVRKPTSRKGGNLELFNWVGLTLSQGRNLDIVTEAETVKSFKSWRKDLRKVALAYHFCEQVEKLTAERVPSQEIFSLLAETLENLSWAEEKRQEFARRLLEETGFWPRGKPGADLDLESYLEKISEKRMSSKRIFQDLLS